MKHAKVRRRVYQPTLATGRYKNLRMSLSAAKLLCEYSSIHVTVLEARDRVGGRVFTKRDPKIKWVDLGGSHVGPTQNRILRLAKEFGINTYLVNDIESQVHYYQGKRLYVPATALVSTWNPFALMDIYTLLRKIDEIGNTIPLDAPWAAPNAEELDRTSTKEFADKICWTNFGKNYWNLFMNVSVCCEPHETSLLWYCWYVRACGGVNRFFSTTNGGQERKLDGGAQQIPEKIAKIIGDRLKLKSPVSSIYQDEKCIKVQTVSGQTYQADYVILAIPPILQMKIHFTPDLPPNRSQMIQRIPMGSVIKCMVYYKKPFWRDNGLSGSMQISDPSDKFPVCFALDDTKPDGSCACILGFISSDKARSLTYLTPEERLEYVAECYAKSTGLDEFRRPIHYEEKNWMSEQYSGGCYVGHFPPGCLTSFGPLLRQPHGRIYFAGTETATHWSGYMEGAVQAGERAAKEVISELGHILVTDIWLDEPPSDEVIPRPFKRTFTEKYLPSITTCLRFIGISSLLTTVTLICYKKCAR